MGKFVLRIPPLGYKNGILSIREYYSLICVTLRWKHLKRDSYAMIAARKKD